MYKKLILSLLSVFVLACKEKNSQIENIPFDQEQVQGFNRAIAIADWQRDSAGCLGVRKDLLVRGMVKHLNIKGLTGTEIQKILGPPNEKSMNKSKVYNNQDIVTLGYYSEGDCQDRETSEVFVLSVFTVVVSAKTDSVLRVGSISR